MMRVILSTPWIGCPIFSCRNVSCRRAPPWCSSMKSKRCFRTTKAMFLADAPRPTSCSSIRFLKRIRSRPSGFPTRSTTSTKPICGVSAFPLRWAYPPSVRRQILHRYLDSHGVREDTVEFLTQFDELSPAQVERLPRFCMRSKTLRLVKIIWHSSCAIVSLCSSRRPSKGR